MENVIKTDCFNLLESEAKKIYEGNKYIVTYNEVYKIHYNEINGFYAIKVYQIAKRFHHFFNFNLKKYGEKSDVFTSFCKSYAIDDKTFNRILGFNF